MDRKFVDGTERTVFENVIGHTFISTRMILAEIKMKNNQIYFTIFFDTMYTSQDFSITKLSMDKEIVH